MAFLEREHDRSVLKAARYIRGRTAPEGGWSNHPGGPVDISVSVKAYFAPQTGGLRSPAALSWNAHGLEFGIGGAACCNSYSKFYLALLGQFPYENCPAVPPELCLLPRWSYLNLYAMSSWTRTIVVPADASSYACKPVRHLPAGQGIAELFIQEPHTPLWPHPPSRRCLTCTNFFLGSTGSSSGLRSGDRASPAAALADVPATG